MIGGSLVDANTTRPIVGMLLVQNDDDEIVRSCEALLLKRTVSNYPYFYFLTAAECFDDKS